MVKDYLTEKYETITNLEFLKKYDDTTKNFSIVGML